MNEPRQTARAEPPPPRPDWREDPAFSEWTSGFEDYGLHGDAGVRRDSGRIPDFSAVFALLDAFGRLVPPELQHQFNQLVREVLKTLRAVIDWYLERLEEPDPEPHVEDIPIDFD